MKPLAGTQNRVVVLPDPVVTRTASGIYIPDSAQDKPQTGTVYKVSEKDGDEKTPTVKENDKIVYSKYSGQDINIDGTDYLIVRESDIYLIL